MSDENFQDFIEFEFGRDLVVEDNEYNSSDDTMQMVERIEEGEFDNIDADGGDDEEREIIIQYEEEVDEEDPPKDTILTDITEYVVEHVDEEYEQHLIETQPKIENDDSQEYEEYQAQPESEEIPCVSKVIEHKGPRRYLLFDDLVATIVDYDAEDTPIVEFALSGADADEKLPVECGICPDVMHKSKLHSHLKSHLIEDENRYKCVYCQESYKDYKYLAGHARRHMGIRPYVCEPCKLYFSTKQDLRVHHQRRHHAKDLICEICGKSFSQNTMLKRHREATHEKKRRFQCAQCPKAYYKNFSLQEHIRNVHMGKRRMLVCPFCGMECRDAHKMARHRKQLHLSQSHYQCHICQEEFTDINYFDAHKRSIQCRNNTRRKMEVDQDQLIKEQAKQQQVQDNNLFYEITVQDDDDL